MLKTSKSKSLVNKTVFNAWIGLMRLTCLLFLINQSQSLGANFTFYFIAVMCLTNPTLSNIEKFRISSKKNRKVYSWMFMAVMTAIAAYIWGQISGAENANQIALGYIAIAVETTLIFISTHCVLLIIDLFKQRREKRLSKVANKAAQSS